MVLLVVMKREGGINRAELGVFFYTRVANVHTSMVTANIFDT